VFRTGCQREKKQQEVEESCKLWSFIICTIYKIALQRSNEIGRGEQVM
jgi:hypothetical protein